MVIELKCEPHSLADANGGSVPVKATIIVAILVIVLIIVYFVGIAPLMRLGAERSALHSTLSGKKDMAAIGDVKPARIGGFTLTSQTPAKIPISMPIDDTAGVYSGPAGTISFYHAKTTEWGRQPVDHAGVMQSTSRALDDVASGPLMRLDVTGHPLVRAQMTGGKWCYCWMNQDNIFCVVADNKEAAAAFIAAYPY